MTDDDPDGTEFCMKFGKDMTQAQKDAWVAEENKKTMDELDARESKIAAEDKARDEETKLVAAANETCHGTENWSACGDNSGVIGSLAYGEISVACEHAADAQARYGTPVLPWLPFREPVTGDSAIKAGIITVSEHNATFQNQFGAAQHVTLFCSYNFNAKTAEVTVIPK
jgi:hypothetical protein